MANLRRRPHTTLIAASLGVLLASEITGMALARTNPVVIIEPAVAAAAVAPTTAASADNALLGLGSALGRAIGSASTVTTGPIVEGLRSSSALTVSVAPAARPAKAQARATVKAVKPTARTIAHVARASFHGRNHVWIPSLGISRGLQSFPCSRSRPPDAGVYRWGCAGRNNVYLLAHAWSTFKPLHDAYVHGRLRKGMQVWYADTKGAVRQYRVIWWKLTLPTTAASWAWAAQSRPSMTLQTCVGAKSQYRLMVRLVQVR